MPGESFSEYAVIRRVVEAELSDVYVARPGKVTAYDPLTNTAFVKPGTKRALYKTDGERVFEELPEIPFVPVIMPRAGGKSIRMPVQAGDTVLLVFTDTSMAEWRAGEDSAEPLDAREHSIGWPVAFVGLSQDTNPPPPLDAAEVAAGGMVIGDENSTAKIYVGGTIPGIRFGQLAVSPVALAVPLMAYVNAAAAAATAGGASDTAVASALTAIQAALAAIVAIPANGAAGPQVTASGTAVSAAATATAASNTAAGAASAAATTAAGAVPSTLTKSL